MQTTAAPHVVSDAPATTLQTYLFDSCGYVRQPEYLDSLGVSRLLNLLDSHWPETARAGVRRIRSLTSACDEFKHFATELAHNLQLYDYINQPFRLIESYALHRSANSVQTLHNGFSQPNASTWGTSHRAMWRHHTYHDGRIYCMMVKVLVYLTDIVSEEDGPFCFIEGSHKANFAFPLSQADIDDGVAPLSFPSLRTVFPHAGDVTVLNEALMHGTLPKVSPEPRVVMAFSYAPTFVTDYRALPDTAASDIWSQGFCE